MLIKRSALVARSASTMFELIERVEDYPGFLPWCRAVTLLERGEEVVAAELLVHAAGMDLRLSTRNPVRRPTWMAIHLERGPFRRFEGVWRLLPLGDDACKVSLEVEFDWAGQLGAHLAGPIVHRAADRIVDAFVAQAMSRPPAPPPAPAAEADPADAERGSASVPVPPGAETPLHDSKPDDGGSPEQPGRTPPL